MIKDNWYNWYSYLVNKFKNNLTILNVFFLIYITNFQFLILSDYLSFEYINYDFKDLLNLNNLKQEYFFILIPLLISLIFVFIYKYSKFKLTFGLIAFLNFGIISIILTIFRVSGFSRLLLILNIILVPLFIVFILEYFKSFETFIFLGLLVITIFFTVDTFNNSQNETSIEVPLNLGQIEFNYTDHIPSENTKVENFQNFISQSVETRSLNDKYQLEKFRICCTEYNSAESGPPVRQKSVGYISVHNDNIFYLTGTGEIFFFDGRDVESKQINFNYLDSNFLNINKNKNVPISGPDFKESWESTKDLMIIDDNIYLSYVNEPSENCINTEILVAEINLDFLQFEPFFQDSECITRSGEDERKLKPFNAHLAGGKMLYLPDTNSVMFSRGGFRDYKKAQDKDSLFGKIILIDIQTRSLSVPAMGTRNPQGLTLTRDGKQVLETEHGPNGGDEINLIDLSKEYQNYGWPLSSYGDHWDLDYYELHGEYAPLHKSHSEYGFIEPVVYFNQYKSGHGISDIDINLFTNKNNYFVATMNAGMLYDIEFNESHTEYEQIDAYGIGERIRDIEYYPNGNFYILVLESTPSFGILTKK